MGNLCEKPNNSETKVEELVDQRHVNFFYKKLDPAKDKNLVKELMGDVPFLTPLNNQKLPQRGPYDSDEKPWNQYIDDVFEKNSKDDHKSNKENDTDL